MRQRYIRHVIVFLQFHDSVKQGATPAEHLRCRVTHQQYRGRSSLLQRSHKEWQTHNSIPHQLSAADCLVAGNGRYWRSHNHSRGIIRRSPANGAKHAQRAPQTPCLEHPRRRQAPLQSLEDDKPCQSLEDLARLSACARRTRNHSGNRDSSASTDAGAFRMEKIRMENTMLSVRIFLMTGFFVLRFPCVLCPITLHISRKHTEAGFEWLPLADNLFLSHGFCPKATQNQGRCFATLGQRPNPR